MKTTIKPQPHSRKKRPKEKTPLDPVRCLILLLVVFVPSVLVYIWLHVQTVGFSYDIAKAQKQKRELQEMIKKLRIQLANLKSPERIERIALTQLGLKPPEKGQIEILK